MVDKTPVSAGPDAFDPADRVEAATRDECGAALNLVFSELPDEVRLNTCEALLAAAAGGEIAFGGLLVARRAGQLRGAVWAQPAGQHLASVWPPRVCQGEPDETIRRLLAALDDYLAAHHVRLAQALLEHKDQRGARSLEAGGFHASTDLAYLICPLDRFPAKEPEPPLYFQPFADQQRQRLLDVVTRTYAGTCDFPELNHVCDAEDALLGYQQAGTYRPDHWFLVQDDGCDVGCLLLGDHPRDHQFELLYMGLVPEVRGRSLGSHVARQALWLTRQADRRQLVLGVDAANEPALKMYFQLGFSEWDRRRVLLKSFAKNV